MWLKLADRILLNGHSLISIPVPVVSITVHKVFTLSELQLYSRQRLAFSTEAGGALFLDNIGLPMPYNLLDFTFMAPIAESDKWITARIFSPKAIIHNRSVAERLRSRIERKLEYATIAQRLILVALGKMFPCQLQTRSCRPVRKQPTHCIGLRHLLAAGQRHHASTAQAP